MSTQLIRITSDVEIPYLTYAGQPVLTFALIDKVHNRPDGTARRNFNTNRERFIEKEDYFQLSQTEMEAMDEIRPSMNPKGILLITESGYLMLVKSFTDDLSWQIQRQLVKLYFRVKEVAEQPAPQPTLSAEQWQVIRDLIRSITGHCKFDQCASFAIHERIRFQCGLRGASELRPEHFEDIKAELESLRTLAAQHFERMVTLDKEFITAVLRPPVSVRKVRALAKRPAQQPPLSY